MTLEHFDSILAFVIVITGISLIVTALNQAVSALLGLRGSHLRWGIKTLLTNLDPRLEAYAQTISEKVLHHPLISDSTFSRFDCWLFRRWKLASAIRKDELINILQLLAGKPNRQAGATSTSGSLLTSPAGQLSATSAVPPAKEDWKSVLTRSLLQPDAQAAQDLLLVAANIRNLFPRDDAKADRLIAATNAEATQIGGEIERWFDSVMDRSSQRFALHMRIWTVVFAFLLAFGLQLDVIKLFTQLSTDAQLRTQIISSADTLKAKADELLVTSKNASPAVYALAMTQLVAEHTDELKGLVVPNGFRTAAEAQVWLAAELKKRNLSDPDNQWAKRFEEIVPQAKLRAATENLNSLLSDKLIIQIVPVDYPNPFYKNWNPMNRDFWGIVASAIFLSMGAPFWFNVLKTLGNLRPVLANKMQEEAETDASANASK